MSDVINNDIVERSTTNYTQNLSTHHNMTRNLENINNEVYNNALRTTSNKGFYQNESQFESNMFHENEFVETKMEIAPELTDSFSQCEVNVQDSDDAQGIRQCNKDRLSSSIVKTRGKSLNGNTSFLGLSGYLWDTINKEGDKFIINDWDIFDHNNNRKTESMTTKHLHNASKMLNSKPQYAVTVSVFSLFIGNNFNASRRIHAKSRSTYQNLRQDIARTRTSKRKSQMWSFYDNNEARSVYSRKDSLSTKANFF